MMKAMLNKGVFVGLAAILIGLTSSSVALADRNRHDGYYGGPVVRKNYAQPPMAVKNRGWRQHDRFYDRGHDRHDRWHHHDRW